MFVRVCVCANFHFHVSVYFKREKHGLMGHIFMFSYLSLLPGKPRGLRTARKHVNHRRDQRWADKDYKKAHLGTRWKANPFGGASHAKGIVLEKV